VKTLWQKLRLTILRPGRASTALILLLVLSKLAPLPPAVRVALGVAVAAAVVPYILLLLPPRRAGGRGLAAALARALGAALFVYFVETFISPQLPLAYPALLVGVVLTVSAIALDGF
jgi:hypothetical protein